MPYNYSTEKLLGLQDLIITNIKESNKTLQIFAKLEVKEQHSIVNKLLKIFQSEERM